MPPRRRTCEAGTEGNENPELKLYWKHYTNLMLYACFYLVRVLNALKCLSLQKVHVSGGEIFFFLNIVEVFASEELKFEIIQQGM